MARRCAALVTRPLTAVADVYFVRVTQELLASPDHLHRWREGGSWTLSPSHARLGSSVVTQLVSPYTTPIAASTTATTFHAILHPSQIYLLPRTSFTTSKSSSTRVGILARAPGVPDLANRCIARCIATAAYRCAAAEKSATLSLDSRA